MDNENDQIEKIVAGKSTKEIFVSINFSKQDVTIKDTGSYKAVHIKDGLPAGMPGQPSLPWRKFYLAIPWDAVIKNIIIKKSETIKLADKINIAPIQPDFPINLAPVKWLPPDQEIYKSPHAYPKAYAKTLGIKRKGVFAMAEFSICPFRYYPSSKKLDMVERVDLCLSYSQKRRKLKRSATVEELIHERKFAEKVKEMVINPDDVLKYIPLDDIGTYYPCNFITLQQIDYVIITKRLLAGEFEPLRRWRTEMGLNSRIVAVEDIIDGTVPGTENIQGEFPKFKQEHDDAEAIRNFLKWAIVNWHIDYALIGGVPYGETTKEVPVRKAIKYGPINDVMYDGVNIIRYWDIDLPDFEAKGFEGYSKAAKSNPTDYLPDPQLGVNPSASSNVSSAANIIDDDDSTFWTCSTSDPNPWISLDVPHHIPFNCVFLKWGSGTIPSYKMKLVSQEGNEEEIAKTKETGLNSNQTYIEHRFPCRSFDNECKIMLEITGGISFALYAMEIHGPCSNTVGVAYRFENETEDEIITRLYVHSGFNELQPAPPEDGIQFIVMKSNTKSETDAKYGTVIEYKLDSDKNSLGWHFVEDLLAGGLSTTVTNFIEIRGPKEFHGEYEENLSPFFSARTWENYIPTDLYYSDIGDAEYDSNPKADWDENENEIYGEGFETYPNDVDRVNGEADIYVGRAPVKDVGDVKIFVNKIIFYEKYEYKEESNKEEQLYPDDFAVSVLLGSGNWRAIDDPANPLDRSAVVSEEIKNIFMEDSADRDDKNKWRIARRYEDYDNMINKDGDLMKADTNNIIDSIKANKNVVNLISHGGTDGLCFLNSSNIEGVKNIPGIFFGNACHTAAFDQDCFALKAILNPEGGAVAYVGACRMGHTGCGPLSVEFWKELLRSGLLGEMFNKCKIPIKDVSYVWNLLGDPAMRVWSEVPLVMNVSSESQICTGHQTFEVKVTCDGRPVENALVCLTMEGDDPVTNQGALFAIERTDKYGIALRTITPLKEGEMLVAVSAKNKIPHRKTVMVKDCPGPSCGSLVGCGSDIALKGKNGLPCPNNLKICKPLIASACVGSIKIDPVKQYEYFYDIWGIRDVGEFLKLSDTPAIKETIEKMPASFRKPMMQMIKRMKREMGTKRS